MKKIMLSLTIISVLFFSCSKETTEQSSNTVDTETHDDHDHDTKNEAIELNKGAKWKVDAPMLAIIRNIEDDIQQFEITSNKDYKTLSSKIDTNIEALTSNCTMEGQAHDELHKWLLPLIDLADTFSESKTEQASAATLKQLKESMVTFNTYFE